MPAHPLKTTVLDCECGDHSWAAASNAPLTILVSAEDRDILAARSWSVAKSHGYVQARIDGKCVYLHRLILSPGGGVLVDHARHTKTDNRRSRLRLCPGGENTYNTRSRGGHSSFKGVCRSRSKKNPWFAMIVAGGVRRYLGLHQTEEQAARAYDQAAAEFHGEFAQLNFGGQRA